jgi:SAM-dependent methyltransferase
MIETLGTLETLESCMSLRINDCPICQDTGETLHEMVQDLVVGKPGSWSILRCTGTSCDAVWLTPRPEPSEIGFFYEGYYTHGTTRPVGGFAERYLWPNPYSARNGRSRTALLNSRAKGRVLEIGCGNGNNLALLQQQGWEVVGQDIDPEAARIASTTLSVEVQTRPIEECNFETASFDMVLTNHVLEHVESPVAVLREAKRVLREGGISINFTPNAASTVHRAFGKSWRGLEAPRHFSLLGPQAAKLALTQAGFAEHTVSTFGYGSGYVSAVSVLQRLGVEGRLGNLLRPALTVPLQLLDDLACLAFPLKRWELCLVGHA